MYSKIPQEHNEWGQSHAQFFTDSASYPNLLYAGRSVFSVAFCRLSRMLLPSPLFTKILGLIDAILIFWLVRPFKVVENGERRFTNLYFDHKRLLKVRKVYWNLNKTKNLVRHLLDSDYCGLRMDWTLFYWRCPMLLMIELGFVYISNEKRNQRETEHGTFEKFEYSLNLVSVYINGKKWNAEVPESVDTTSIKLRKCGRVHFSGF